jgi:hypothetical protein
MSKKITIQKIGDTAPPVPISIPAPAPMSASGRKRRTMRTFPKGILKGTIKGVKDPAKPPPLKKSGVRGTLRIMTEKGIEQKRRHIKKTVKNMPDRKVKDELKKAGMPVSEKTPPHIAKEILEGGMEAGMIVLK